MKDLPVLAFSYVYVFGVLAAAEGLRRWRGYSVGFTRKAIHIAAGMSAWLLPLFEHLPLALIPPLSFILVTVLSYRKGIFQAMETGERGNLGTIYFPISFSILTCLFWEQRPLLVAALMPLTWGDALAAMVGQRWGRIRFHVPGSTRSLEGSLTFLASSWIATALPLALLPTSPCPGWTAVLVALEVATGAALVEALTPWRLDNLTVPAVSALLLWLV
jgi:phytol kinase